MHDPLSKMFLWFGLPGSVLIHVLYTMFNNIRFGILSPIIHREVTGHFNKDFNRTGLCHCGLATMHVFFPETVPARDYLDMPFTLLHISAEDIRPAWTTLHRTATDQLQSLIRVIIYVIDLPWQLTYNGDNCPLATRSLFHSKENCQGQPRGHQADSTPTPSEWIYLLVHLFRVSVHLMICLDEQLSDVNKLPRYQWQQTKVL